MHPHCARGAPALTLLRSPASAQRAASRRTCMEAVDGVLVVPPGEGAHVPRPNGGTVVYKATGEETAGAYGLAEYTVPPASDPSQPRLGVLAHRHAGEDESWYILEGELIFTI